MQEEHIAALHVGRKGHDACAVRGEATDGAGQPISAGLVFEVDIRTQDRRRARNAILLLSLPRADDERAEKRRHQREDDEASHALISIQAYMLLVAFIWNDMKALLACRVLSRRM